MILAKIKIYFRVAKLNLYFILFLCSPHAFDEIACIYTDEIIDVI